MRRACSAFAAFLGRGRDCYCPYRADDVSHVIPPVPAWYCLFLPCLDLVFPVACRCDKKATVWSQQTTPYSAEQKIYGLRRKQTNNKQLEKEETHSRRASASCPSQNKLFPGNYAVAPPWNTEIAVSIKGGGGEKYGRLPQENKALQATTEWEDGRGWQLQWHGQLDYREIDTRRQRLGTIFTSTYIHI